MKNSKPSKRDRFCVKFWSKEKALKELRVRILCGDVEWAALLLEKTEYQSLNKILDVTHWKNESEENFRNVRNVVLALFDKIPQKQLPQGINKSAIFTAFTQALLRKAPIRTLKKKS